ncbi:peptidylprolyl isomerase [bacterium]|nr:peptidylprolyl isomerase [bacterium]
MRKILFLLLLVLACSGEQEKIFSSDYGEISVETFKELYTNLLAKTPLMDSYQNRVEYLYTLYQNKGIAEKSKKTGIKFSEQDEVELEFYKRKLLTEKFFEAQIDAKFPEPTEAEIRETFRRMNTEIKVGNIFSKNKAEIDSIFEEIQSGKITFEEAAFKHYVGTDSSLAQNAGYDKFFGFGEMDFDFEENAYKLKKDEISKPFKSAFGYHLLKIKSLRGKVFIPESEFQAQKSKISTKFKNLRNKNASDKFVQKLFAEKDVRIKTAVLKSLFKNLQPYLNKNNWENPQSKINEIEHLLSEKDVLATFGGEELKVKDFLAFVPFLSHREMKENPLGAVESVIMKKILSDEAIKSGLFENVVLQEKMEIERDRILKNNYLASQISKIDTSEQKLKEHFEKNKYRFESEQKFKVVRFACQKEVEREKLRSKIFVNTNKIKVDTLGFVNVAEIIEIKDSGKVVSFKAGEILGAFEKEQVFIYFEILEKEKGVGFVERKEFILNDYLDLEIKRIVGREESFARENGNLVFDKVKLENLFKEKNVVSTGKN